jgi:hypothetical protein
MLPLICNSINFFCTHYESLKHPYEGLFFQYFNIQWKSNAITCLQCHKEFSYSIFFFCSLCYNESCFWNFSTSSLVGWFHNTLFFAPTRVICVGILIQNNLGLNISSHLPEVLRGIFYISLLLTFLP